ncbi:hypothetical protein AcV7_008770 [Taiwanofungus camphoratus]|nr:hypothetical protein AcV7_008770 [Antrodia cinnamomea]
MPVSARKSSIGSRRAPQKYIPYRADDFQHGKKTGIAVAYVDHMSDEFEPFEKVMSQADQRTPPRVQAIRKKRAPKTPVVEESDDENGEMSMELEDSIPNSPSAYFQNARVTSIVSSVQRVGSSSRPVARTSDVDFDKVPSPRPSSAFSSRKSSGRGRSPPGPSQLSQSTMAQDYEDIQMDYGGMDEGRGGLDFEAGFDSDDDDEPPVSSYQQQQSQQKRKDVLPRRSSFMQIDQDDEDDEEQVEAEMGADGSPMAKVKGKLRVNGDLPHQDMEEDFAQGLAEVDQEPMDEDEEQLRESDRNERSENNVVEKQRAKNKKARSENEGARKPRGRPRKQNVLREVLNDENADDGNGLRRGKRTRYAPLEWWRLEKVVYGRRDSGTTFVPNIKEIRRLPKEEPRPLGAKHRKRRPPQSKSKSQTAEVDAEGQLVFNPEEGWDAETDSKGCVMDYDKDEEIEKRVAFTAKMLTPKAAANNDFYFQKIFGDGDFIAAGQLIIPPNKQKPTKGTKDNTFVSPLSHRHLTELRLHGLTSRHRFSMSLRGP